MTRIFNPLTNDDAYYSPAEASILECLSRLGERPILIDTGSPGEVESLRFILRKHQIEFSDLALIAHTHVHSDHLGNTAAIAAEFDCPIGYHPADQPMVARSNNGRLNGVGLRGKVMSRFFSEAPFEPVRASLQLTEGMSLNAYGADLLVMETPGHTPGSISFITPNGDAIIGDIIMGGYMGGNVFRTKPNLHCFADNLAQAMKSLGRVLTQTSGKLYVGHGGPLEHASVKRWYHGLRSPR